MAAPKIPNIMTKEQALNSGVNSFELTKTKEIPYRKVDALIVLDAGYKKARDERFIPTLETKMRLMATAHLFDLGFTERLILCGGKLYGENLPADSEVMKKYLLSPIIRKRFHINIPEEVIITENQSRTTSENFRFVKEIIEKHPEIETIGVISHWHHLKFGAEIAAQTLELKPVFFNVDEILKARSSHYQKLIRRYYYSLRTEPIKKFFVGAENLFRLGVLIFDREGRMLSWLADQELTAGKLAKKFFP